MLLAVAVAARVVCKPASIEADLRRAAKVLRPRMFKLVGGEPLLHPALVELVQRVRATGIAPVISVTTNGLKLGEMTDAFWQAVDALTISRYPKPSLSPDLVAHIERQAARFDVRLNWKVQDVFTTMNRAQPGTDRDAAQRLYHDCWIRERCHMIRDGMFYTCTRPAHFHTLYQGREGFSVRRPAAARRRWHARRDARLSATRGTARSVPALPGRQRAGGAASHPQTH